MPSYTGFGSGPYNTLLYDRSWVTAFVTLGVSIADNYSADVYITDTLTFGAAVEAVKLADGYIYADLTLGFQTNIPAVSVGGNYGVDLTIGGLVVDDQFTVNSLFNSSLTFDVSLAEQQTTKHEVHDTVTLGVSVADIPSAQATMNTALSLGTGFVYNNTASFVFNNLMTFATQITAEVSSTGRYIDQWSSVTAAAAETWTTVAAGAAEAWVSVGGATPETWTTVSLGFD